ncbi:MAG TPA: FHA domain-containing protein [Anaerolineae bacterium]|nr:FHA domain-containing protein [Anaerolineae bacterium]
MLPQPRFKLVMDQGPTPGHEFELTQDSIIMGREMDKDVDYVISSPTVSRRHACITRKGQQYFLVDLGSSNGTFLNGERLGGEPRPLKSDDRIQLGGTVTLILRSVGAADPTRVAKRDETPLAATMLGDLEDYIPPTTPPQFIVIVAGEPPNTYNLTREAFTIGRADDNDIVISAKTVSRHHARLEIAPGGYQFVTLPEASNPVLFEGRPLSEPRLLRHNDILRIGSLDAGLMVTMVYHSPSEAAVEEEALTIKFGEKNLLQIGRDPGNDVVLDAPNISRFHAQVELIGQRYRISDLRSSNGTFVNDQRVEGDVWLNPEDTIRIGPYRFVMGEDALAQYDESSGLRADMYNLNKWVHKDLNILQNISATFKPRELIVIVGQSGGGKTTLLDAIAGYRPATHGRVFVNDIDIYRNFDAIRQNIGYVPQENIIHMELTVYQALDYAARLRMPPDTTNEERHQRIMEVLDDLDIAHRKDTQVSSLSGGQQKRVSIGVELLTSPGLFFLDEATSGLDPGTETALMQLLRRLADQGRTIVLVTHATKNVMLADRVLFMARGGYLAWFGPPDEALEYFDQHRSENERRTSDMEFDKIYAILETPQHGSPEDWSNRYQTHPAYQRYILEPLEMKRQELEAAQVPSPEEIAPIRAPKVRRQVSSLRQFLILSSRNIKILTRDRVSLILMLGAAPLVALLDVLIAFMVGSNPFDFVEGSFEDIMMGFFLIVIFAVFVGALSQMREIVKENQIYKRERLVNLKIAPYVFSKVWIAVLLALYHAAAYTIIHNLAYDMPGGAQEFILMYVSMLLAAMAGMMLGLFTSAISPNANTAPMIVIVLLMPQIVLSGSLVPLPGPVSAPASTRWAFEGLMSISGVGSDIASDLCWELPEELREVMSIEDKTAQCKCMGLNVLREEICSFPGAGEFYDPAIEEPAPIEPPPLRDKPPEPEIPPAPEKPEDESDSVAMAEYFEAMELYQEELTAIQDGYRAEMEVYEAEAEVYQAEMEAYLEENLEWEIAREAAVNPAEGLIGTIYEDYGWTFVDKNDSQAFWSKILTTWIAQGVIIAVLLLGVLLMVKRKDAV